MGIAQKGGRGSGAAKIFGSSSKMYPKFGQRGGPFCGVLFAIGMGQQVQKSVQMQGLGVVKMLLELGIRRG